MTQCFVLIKFLSSSWEKDENVISLCKTKTPQIYYKILQSYCGWEKQVNKLVTLYQTVLAYKLKGEKVSLEKIEWTVTRAIS